MSSGSTIVLDGVHRRHGHGAAAVDVLVGADARIGAGETVAVVGRSGSGKTTLLNLILGLDRPDSGRVLVGDIDLTTKSDDELATVRRERMGVIFQAFGLIPMLTAAENVEVPLRLRAVDPEERDTLVADALSAVGLARRAAHRPSELSGGEQQRVAVARALVGRPELMIADEPTGQLDRATGRRVMELLLRLVSDKGMTLVVATHDGSMVAAADRRLEIRGGHVLDVVSGNRVE